MKIKTTDFNLETISEQYKKAMNIISFLIYHY